LIKVYVVIHIHKFASPSECLEGHVDSKHIGTFHSKNKAITTIEKYKNLEGFKDYPNEFYIHEYFVDSIYNSYITELLKSDIKQAGSLEVLFFLNYVREFEDGHDDIKLLGVFSSEKIANEALKKIRKIPGLVRNSGDFLIEEENVKLLGWTEGFTTIS